MSDFLIFRRFESMDEATAVQKILTKKNIPSVLAEERALLDNNIIGQLFEPPYHVKIPAEHFVEAEKVLHQSTDISAIEVEDDYYLLTFSDKELMEIIEKKDEWGSYDYALALQLLEGRGITLTDADIEHLNTKRITSLAVPEDGINIYTVLGYFLAAFGGVLGICIGLFMMISKKTLPDGSRVHTYDSRTQTHGFYITLLGATASILWNIFYWVFDGSLLNIGTLFSIFRL